MIVYPFTWGFIAVLVIGNVVDSLKEFKYRVAL